MSRKHILAGPMNGAAEKAAIGTPLSSLLHKSANVPPTSVMGAEKAIPPIALHTSRVSMFSATAHGMMNTTARRSVEPLPEVSMVTVLRIRKLERTK